MIGRDHIMWGHRHGMKSGFSLKCSEEPWRYFKQRTGYDSSADKSSYVSSFLKISVVPRNFLLEKLPIA